MSDQQGSFIGGLALGMFAGAMGYFLFATKDGSKTREKIEREWQEAKAVLADEGLIKDKNVSLSDLVGEWFGIETKKTLPKKKNSKTTPPHHKTDQPKFKGV